MWINIEKVQKKSMELNGKKIKSNRTMQNIMCGKQDIGPYMLNELAKLLECGFEELVDITLCVRHDEGKLGNDNMKKLIKFVMEK